MDAYLPEEMTILCKSFDIIDVVAQRHGSKREEAMDFGTLHAPSIPSARERSNTKAGKRANKKEHGTTTTAQNNIDIYEIPVQRRRKGQNTHVLLVYAFCPGTVADADSVYGGTHCRDLHAAGLRQF